MSDAAGAAINAVAGIVKALIPTSTTSNTSGDGTAQSSSSQHAEVDSATSTHATMQSIVDSFLQTDNKQSSYTQNSADPDVIANLKSLAADAVSNANDPSKTKGLISGILQNAGDAMTAVFGNQKTAGIYGGSVASTEADATNARAAATAASAVLGYQTQEQTIAADAYSRLLAATATSRTDNEQISTQTGKTVTNTVNDSNTLSQAITDSSQNSAAASSNKSVTTSKTSSSVVCTWMFRNGLLKREDYQESMRQFLAMSQAARDGYSKFAAPILVELRARPNSWKSRCYLFLFRHRTNWVCGRRNFKGAIGLSVIATGSTVCGLWLLAFPATNAEPPVTILSNPE